MNHLREQEQKFICELWEKPQFEKIKLEIGRAWSDPIRSKELMSEFYLELAKEVDNADMSGIDYGKFIGTVSSAIYLHISKEILGMEMCDGESNHVTYIISKIHEFSDSFTVNI